ncbi:hypothetical protein [Quatrionicoccus australiensis]|uniref:hypothetical protein n=1 Tax=Quatrionicoccus australiensis TaxID=138118 RepID=UPI001CFC1872|nr:hypothetical protein [Quatrionicoccus australiensis]MCB4359295.1 hypothetical protein [Quatrionicoccus australiensis]
MKKMLGRQREISLPHLIVVFTYIFSICTICQAEETKRIFNENPLPVIETDLQFMSGPNQMVAASWEFRVHWLSNRLFMVMAAQDIPDVNILQAERTMLVDAETGESRQLLDPGWVLWCFNPLRGVGAIRPSPFKPELPFKSPEQNDWQYKWVRIDSAGTVTKIPDVADLGTHECLPRGLYPKNSWALHEGHGYIQRAALGLQHTLGDKATYVVPNKPAIELNIHFSEIKGGWRQYLEYARKYQLNYYDPHGTSMTDKRLAGNSWGNRPYALTPFRLLSLDGSIEEIPYPEIIYEYGLKGVGYFLFTPVGLLITPNTSIMLLNDERLTRIWGKPTSWFHTPESVFAMQLSPDGCKLVFGRAANWKVGTRKPIAILNLCQSDTKPVREISLSKLSH